MSEVSFKQRVINDLIAVAPLFKSTFIDKEYLIFSSKMVNRNYYIISAVPGNFMHLTGIRLSSPIDFYNKCINGTLLESDINIPSNKEKGSIRRKINALPNLLIYLTMKSLLKKILVIIMSIVLWLQQIWISQLAFVNQMLIMWLNL